MNHCTVCGRPFLFTQNEWRVKFVKKPVNYNSICRTLTQYLFYCSLMHSCVQTFTFTRTSANNFPFYVATAKLFLSILTAVFANICQVTTYFFVLEIRKLVSKSSADGYFHCYNKHRKLDRTGADVTCKCDHEIGPTFACHFVNWNQLTVNQVVDPNDRIDSVRTTAGRLFLIISMFRWQIQQNISGRPRFSYKFHSGHV